MISVLPPDHQPEDRRQLVASRKALGLWAHESAGEKRTVLGAIGDGDSLRQLPVAKAALAAGERAHV